MKSVMIIVIVAMVVLTACSSQPRYPREEIDKLAKCITANGGVEYGAYWCPNCAKVKKNFGSSFQYIKYVECDPKGDNEQSSLCLEKGIKKYATFIFNDDPNSGNWLVGVPKFEQLAAKAGCPPPQPEAK